VEALPLNDKNLFRSLSAFANYFSKQMEFFEREYRLKVLLLDRKTNPKTALHAFSSTSFSTVGFTKWREEEVIIKTIN
jgi:hypothetical protein